MWRVLSGLRSRERTARRRCRARSSARASPHRLCPFPPLPHRMTLAIREGPGMERFIANLVKSYQSGKIDRRQFCETVALAATVYAAGDAARAAPSGGGFKMLGVNHISYACSDYKAAR